MTDSAPSPSPIEALLTRRLLVVSGKGGVGRTTVAAALAFAAAARGKRVLVAETLGQGRLGRLLGTREPLGSAIQTIDEHIDAVNMNPTDALREYGLLTLRIEALYKVVFENRPVRAFLAAVPGLYAYSMLGKAWYHTTESRGARPRYDLVILDGPASGHALTMLKIPGSLVTAMPKGPLTQDAQSIFDLLHDPARAAMLVVTLAEELPAREALELVVSMRGQGLPMGPLVVNAVPDASWAAPELTQVLDAAGEPASDPALESTLAGVRALASRRKDAEPILQRLTQAVGLPLVTLPRLFAESMGPAETRALAEAL
ncbi:MAG: P-loop NTPase [Myxococcales bacterium]|nr:P-loop NTPase [Myxococcales bacterium]